MEHNNEEPREDNAAASDEQEYKWPEVRTLDASAPIAWLKAGWRDFTRAPLIGLTFGACFMSMGLILTWVFINSPSWTLSLSSGFLLMGPCLSIGLYAVSRKLERAEPPQLLSALFAWRQNFQALALYLGVLLILEMLWSRTALVIFAVTFNTVPDQINTLDILLNPDNLGFVLIYFVVGALFAGLIFATSVTSIPMIMDREVDGISAGITSFRVCLANPGTMFIWGAMITGLVVIAMLPYFIGLLVVGPVLGHASWHAYRAAVD